MKLNVLKRFVVLTICLMFVFLPFLPITTFAALEDIEILGGRYDYLLNAKNEYLNYNRRDTTIYECHHLISKEALNLWGDEINRREGLTPFNNFICDDLNQNWAPSIIMEKADHMLTLSYYNPQTQTNAQNQMALDYIKWQAERIIKNGDIIGVLKNEIDFIQDTFGQKYDRAIREVWQYIRYLEFRHPRIATLIMKNPDNERLFFQYHFNR